MGKTFVRAFVYSFLGLCLLVWLIGLILPSEYTVERSITINAPAEKVFMYVENLEQWEQWSPWIGMDPEAEYTVGKNMSNMQYMSWNGPTMGMGRLDIEKKVANQSINTNLRFYTPYDGQSNGQWKFQENGGATTVTWSNYGILEDLMSKWYTFIVLKGSLGKDFEKGLANLKNVVEKAS